MDEMNIELNSDDTVFVYWKEWLSAVGIDTSKIPDAELIEWVQDMEEVVGDALTNGCIPDEWWDTIDEEWEDLPTDDVDD